MHGLVSCFHYLVVGCTDIFLIYFFINTYNLGDIELGRKLSSLYVRVDGDRWVEVRPSCPVV